ncbi:MAG TPA: DUF3891 family protein [Tepidisphaeraceae bacterium]|jgi:hypothetical protein|nr:DUF3891 family protein [Tepidisphaeraceae bacterium]
MIRNQQGNEFFLFTQDDHAAVSGELARHFGNSRFAAPQPLKAVIDAVAMHDCGWPLHDREPTLDVAGMPLHVFDTPIPLAVRVWAESTRLAREADPYTGLLVSLHVFALSALAYQHYADPAQRAHSAKELFELNKFQQLQIEVQEQIRGESGLRTDVALQLGLAPRRSDAREDLLRFHYQILRTMDQLSLALLLGGRPFSTIDDLSPRPAADPVDFRVGYPAKWRITLNPWPFDAEKIDAEIPFRRVPARVYASVEAFREIYKSAPREMQMLRVARSG